MGSIRRKLSGPFLPSAWMLVGCFVAGGILALRIPIEPRQYGSALGFADSIPTPTRGPRRINDVIDGSRMNIPDDPDSITLVTTGDVIPARVVNQVTLSRGNFLWPWERTAEFLADADITLVNLESPLVPDCPVTSTGMTFCGHPDHALGLVHAGVDVANIANNHTQNYGRSGLDSTRQILTAEGIKTSGFGDVAYLDVKGLRFAFLGYNDLAGNPADNSLAVVRDLGSVRAHADIVVVSFHWGAEYIRQPTPRQILLAHQAVDAGADLVVGNHPHWIQPVEFYRDKLIIYAHGNFIFDQMWSEETTLGIVGKLTFTGKTLAGAEFLPVKIAHWGQPYFLEGDEKLRVMETFRTASAALAEAQAD